MPAFNLPLLYDTIIVDILNVFCTYSYNGFNSTIDSKVFSRMVASQIWGDHETGKLTNDEAHAALAKEFKVNIDDVRSAMIGAITTLSPRQEMVDLIRSLKSGRKIYAMSNMSEHSWNMIRHAKPTHWDIFDDVFISGSVGYRKPEMLFYQHVLQKTGAKPLHTIFLDDTQENLATARIFGIRPIIFDSFSNLERTLINLCGDPVSRAKAFLVRNSKKHHSYASTGQIIYENFCQLMILEATQDPSIVDYRVHKEEWNFFQRSSGQYTDAIFPADLDTTFMAWTVIPEVTTDTVKHRIMDRVISDLLDNDGIPLSYFDRNRARRDHGVCVNVLSMFYASGRGHEVERATDYPESFCSRLLERSSLLECRMGDLLKECCRQRIGSPTDPLALAMRLHCCTRRGLDASVDFKKLIELQQVDGGWEGGIIYTYGLVNITVGNRGLTTAIAHRAITEYLSKFGPTSS
ncbi:Sesquiterpene cyclase astC [Psilocybe cubensis]|uniref:Sesquiterpene cyclase astC n=1 Tax=Psilocybe cubensis TaxID=181762 RepID=A0ACB8GRN2_PSICU|nr:Sesquiterpene cyclase astC [Psilocybe cubensis]KAH9478087.1 Sesquiterpene cyclase astC [Psilocybe cubensis]